MFHLLLSPALAWEHSGYVWVEETIPIVVAEGGPAGLSEGAWEEAIFAAAEAWSAVDCADIELVPTLGKNLDSHSDGVNSVSFDDPGDDIEEGVVVVLYTSSSRRTVSRNGVTYDVITEADIVFNDGVSFATDEEIARGDCVDTWSLQALTTHLFGTLLGLGNSCEAGEPCTEAYVRDATMYGVHEPCNAFASTLGAYDIAALQDLYDCNAGEFVPCSSTKASFSVLSSDGPSWSFINEMPTDSGCVAETSWTASGGDGIVAESTEWDFVVAFPSAGTYTIQLTVVDVEGGSTTEEMQVEVGEEKAPSNCGCQTGNSSSPVGLLAAVALLRRKSPTLEGTSERSRKAAKPQSRPAGGVRDPRERSIVSDRLPG